MSDSRSSRITSLLANRNSHARLSNGSSTVRSMRCRALDQRRILVFDRVAPWELATARTHANVTLVPYAAPTVHLLVPNPRSALLTSATMRRAMDVAIDRQRDLA